MSNLFLSQKEKILPTEIHICGSKSETNRLLILNALFQNPLELHNKSNSEDSFLLENTLNSSELEIDIHHAGTAMRFLTAYFSIQKEKKTILTGSDRMKERPISILVEALRSLGAKINYLEKEGFPPLQIEGQKIEKDFIEIQADISSQFITALLLIAPKLPNGLTIQLQGKITSLPYLLMSINFLKKVGISVHFEDNKIQIQPQKELKSQIFTIESDWSSASYYYSLVALSSSAEIKLTHFSEKSQQGDAQISEIYKNHFGVATQISGTQIQLKKIPDFIYKTFELNLNKTPDIAQTIAVTAAGLGLKCKLTGLKTLKIKETNRLLALQNELKKIGANCVISDDSLEITGFCEKEKLPQIKTYNDHRMAMSFAPLVVLYDIEIENPEVVKKSYPDFWEDWKKLGLL